MILYLCELDRAGKQQKCSLCYLSSPPDFKNIGFGCCWLNPAAVITMNVQCDVVGFMKLVSLVCTGTHVLLLTCPHTSPNTAHSLKSTHGPRHINSFILHHTHMAASHCLVKRCNSSFFPFKLLQHAMCLYGLHSQTGITLRSYSLST